MEKKYIKVAKVDEFADCKLRSVRVLGRPVVIIKDENGDYRAMEAGCKHQNADITKGSIMDGVATCPWHGWKYDLSTGKCIWGSETVLRPYGCRIEEGNVMITLQPLESHY